MNTGLLREKLHQIINTASDEKVKEIYQMIDKGALPYKDWWKNKQIIREFDERVKDWIQDEQKGYSLLDIDREK